MISEKSCSNEVYMQLEGRAHDKHRSMAGKYTMANGFSSGMPYWEESAGTYALVFTKGNWSIGKKSDPGTIISLMLGMYSHTGSNEMVYHLRGFFHVSLNHLMLTICSHIWGTGMIVF